MARPHGSDGVRAGSAAESIYIQVLRMLPRKALSQAVGRLADTRIPTAFRDGVYSTFAAQFGVDVDEAELPMSSYTSVNAFFTRRLRPGVRPINSDEGCVVSPVDARVSQFGVISGGEMVQAKGRTYQVGDLLQDSVEADRFRGGHYATLYLSPKDYHRIHFPAPGSILGYKYHPGHLWPVNPASVHNVDKLFCVNERVTVFMNAFGDVPMAVILVGATCVGRMSLSFDRLVTNVPGCRAERVRYEGGKAVERGAELGMFHLGSTVIMLIGRDAGFTFDDGLVGGEMIRLGQKLGTVSASQPTR
jgi:phosphatidylserine decarboxylase